MQKYVKPNLKAHNQANPIKIKIERHFLASYSTPEKPIYDNRVAGIRNNLVVL
jgi:hypothetical protein